MASQPWIPHTLPYIVDEIINLQWSHGLSAMDTRVTVSRRRPGSATFNGAMASQPWIQHTIEQIRYALGYLQWSHGLSAMDTAISTTASFARVVLQWSHGLSAMDTY